MKAHLLTVLLIVLVIGCPLLGYTFPVAALLVISCTVCSVAVVYSYWFVYKWINSYFGN